MSLDGMPTPSALKAIAAQRQRERFGRLVDPELGGAANVAADRELTAERLDPAICAPIRARRLGDVLELSIETPPRTKKNNGRIVIRTTDEKTHPKVIPSKAFLKYQRELGASIAMVQAQLQLPMPDRAYNAAAEYFLDRYGQDADLCGLDQGLYDALQYCGVITDDWWIRQHDGTRVHLAGLYEGPPRVTLRLTPLLTP